MKGLKNRYNRIVKGLKSRKGFTLIELLIVIAILGVLAAVVIPNISRFTKSGSIAAAKAEKQELQVAVDAAMADAGAAEIDATAPAWKGEDGAVTATDAAGNITDAGIFIKRAPTKGEYDVDIEGNVSCFSYTGLGAADIDKVNGVAP